MANKMKEIRFFKNISQWQVAVSTGMSQGRVSLIERGFILPKDEDKSKIARVLKARVQEIFPPEAQNVRTP